MNIEEQLKVIAQIQIETRRDLDTLTKLHLDGDREWREAQAANEEAQAANEKRFAQVTHNFEVVLDSIKRLETIATAHEQRLDDLEG